MSNKDEIDELNEIDQFIEKAIMYKIDKPALYIYASLKSEYKQQLLALKKKWQNEARVDEIERADSIYNEEDIPLWQYFNERINQLNGDK